MDVAELKTSRCYGERGLENIGTNANTLIRLLTAGKDDHVTYTRHRYIELSFISDKAAGLVWFIVV